MSNKVIELSERIYDFLLKFYPNEHKEQFGAEMEFVFSEFLKDSYDQAGGLGVAILWGRTLVDWLTSVVNQQMQSWKGATVMNLSIIMRPKVAAFVSVLLALPLALQYGTLFSDIDAISEPMTAFLSEDGTRPTTFGFSIIIGGLLMLPFALILNLVPLMRRDGATGKRILHPLNLIVGAVLLSLIALTWGALMVEAVNCLSGITPCD